MAISRRTAARMAAISAPVLGLLFLGEWLLGRLGYPSDAPFEVSNPPGYSALKKNIEFTHWYRANSLGLRYPEIPLQRSGDDYRVLVLGDSFVEGVGVEEDETFPAVLEAKLSGPGRPVRFINAGIQGAGPMRYARLLYHVGLKYQPDAVLVVLYGNDVGDTPEMDDAALESGEGWMFPASSNPHRQGAKKILHGLWPRTYTALAGTYDKARGGRAKDIVSTGIQAAEEKGFSRERIERWRSNLPADLVAAANRGEFSPYILLRDFLEPKFWLRSLDIAGPEAEKKWRGTERALEKIVELSYGRGIRVALAYVPVPYQYDERFGDMTRRMGGVVRKEWFREETELEKRLARWTHERKLPFLNLTPYFRLANKKLNGKCHYPLDGHWTAVGNELAAYAISQWLLDRKLVPPPDRAPRFQIAKDLEYEYKKIIAAGLASAETSPPQP